MDFHGLWPFSWQVKIERPFVDVYAKIACHFQHSAKRTHLYGLCIAIIFFQILNVVNKQTSFHSA